ncbi:hypothetical protein LTS18_002869 [Coniosporium uncinatum]|uniref:Uncharacterized protein n=1 Tax=Coniosporium uncinatum TaxID=93489 RepID=A0ACC3DU27_9PEZI|nr:hypothetical protein LTS18_002869 [Coniosporium uncinatum]
MEGARSPSGIDSSDVFDIIDALRNGPEHEYQSDPTMPYRPPPPVPRSSTEPAFRSSQSHPNLKKFNVNASALDQEIMEAYAPEDGSWPLNDPPNMCSPYANSRGKTISAVNLRPDPTAGGEPWIAYSGKHKPLQQHANQDGSITLTSPSTSSFFGITGRGGKGRN